jgi:GcrA cell cycle regulator
MLRQAYLQEWTEQQVAKLTSLWAEGHSASQIANALAAQFGVRRSRNSCIGKIHRLGLARRATPSRPAKRPVRTVRAKPASLTRAPRLNPVRMPTLSEDRQLAKLLPALGPELTKAPDGLCKFIPGDPLIDASICGRATGHGPYCVQHIRLCYEPSSKKPRVRSERTDEKRRWLRALEREVRA